MDPVTVVEQTGGSRAASSDPDPRGGLPKEAELLWCELRGLAHDHLQLAALETQRAGESLVTMIAAGMIVAGLLLSAWLGLIGAAVLALISRGIMASGSAVLLAVALNLGGRARALWRDPPPESSFTVPHQHPLFAAGGVGVPGCGDILMAADLRSPSTLTVPLAIQIGEAERRLQNRRRLVQIRGAALRQMLHQRMTSPVMLLLAGGLGFFMGELTRRPTPQSRGTDRSPDSGYPFFETVLNFIKLATWVRALFAALPGTGTQPSAPLEAPVQTPDRSQENS